MRKTTGERIRRLKWAVLALTALVITAIEAYYLAQGGSLLDHLIVWLVGIAIVAVVIELVFRELNRLFSKQNHNLAHVQRHGRFQEGLVQLSARLATTFDEEQVCQTFLAELRDAFGFPAAAISLKQADRTEPLRVGDTGVWKRLDKDQAWGGESHKTRLVAPLRNGDDILGNLLVENKTGAPFTPQEMALLYSAADQLAMALQNARWVAAQKEQKSQAEQREQALQIHQHYQAALSAIIREGLRAENEEQMLQTMSTILVEMLAADDVLLATWDAVQKRLMPAVACGDLKEQLEHGEMDALDMAELLPVLSDGQTRIVHQPQADGQSSSRLLARLGNRSLMALALIADDRKLGVAVISFRDTHDFSEMEIFIGEQAAGQIALTVTMAEALRVSGQLAKELEALQHATMALLNTLELEELLGKILDAAMSAAPVADKGLLYLVAPETGELQVRAAHGYSDQRIRTLHTTAGESYPARAVRYRRPFLIADTDNDPLAALDPDDEKLGRSLIVAPLLLSDKALGALILSSNRAQAFTDFDLSLLVSFAATATTAINNAQLHSEVRHQAVTDTLTGLHNRRGLFDLAQREVARSKRFNSPLCAILMDIDMLKPINDTYGHLVGDEILAGVGKQMKAELRQIDLLGRYGGDEFLALLPGTALEEGMVVVERLRENIAGLRFPAGENLLSISISLGVTMMLEDDSLESLIERADQALYTAKQAGRNRLHVE
jgi:diguanylate cyclase (GGDEF)-like protein